MLALTAVGLAALDREGGLLVFRRLEGVIDELAGKIRDISEGRADFVEVDEVLKKLREMDVKSIKVLDRGLYEGVRAKAEKYGVEVSYAPDIKLDLEKIITSSGMVTVEEYRNITRQIYLELSKSRIRVEALRRDIHVVHAVRALDDLEKQRNLIYERVREWYGVHFPELADLVTDYSDYLELVALPLLREKVLSGVIDLPPYLKRAAEIRRACEKSLGSPITESDAKAVASLARIGLETDRQVKSLGEYIRGLVSVEAPNLTAVVGPLLASRLVSLAGSIERLARMPASTIQMLGAEKALFRFLRTGRGAPKHGIIFQHPYVHGASRWQRGKIARALAAKISIAAKIDYFTKEDRSSSLVKSLEARIEEIKKKYAEPPRPASKPVKRRRR